MGVVHLVSSSPNGIDISVVETPPNAGLQSQAPPTYLAVVSGEKF